MSHDMHPLTAKHIRLTPALLLSALLLAGCSGSSSSGDSQSPGNTDAGNPPETENVAADDDTNGAPVPVPTDPVTPDPVTPDPVTPDPVTPDPVTPDPVTPDPVTPDPVTPDPVTPDPVTPDPVTSDPVTPDPVTPDPESNVTRIDFDISVPVYSSSALQVRLVWGDKDLAASWVGDEFWAISDDFPMDTEHPMTITFYDRNGAITLGRIEQVMNTGSEPTASYQFTANQFFTERWDDDRDGISNIDELVEGSDPLVDERGGPEIRESYSITTITAFSGQYYESRIPTERPHFEHKEQIMPLTWNEDYSSYTPGRTEILTIDIDEFGTGTFTDKYFYEEYSDKTTRNRIATRTVAENSVSWMGTYYRYNTGAGVGDDFKFTIETKAVDATTRSQIGVIDRDDSGRGSSYLLDISYSLTGTLQEDTANCKPTSGRIESSIQYLYSGSTKPTSTTIKKEPEDTYWTVTVTTDDGRVLEDEYLVETLDSGFYCDFAELR